MTILRRINDKGSESDIALYQAWEAVFTASTIAATYQADIPADWLEDSDQFLLRLFEAV